MMINNKNQEVNNKLKEVSARTENFLRNVSGSAEHITEQKTSTLYGIIGGIIGTLLGVFIDQIFMIGILDQMVLSGALTMLGVTTGIYRYRGIKRIRIEKHLDEHKIIHDDIISKLRELPSDAPESIKLKYYNYLEDINDNYYQGDEIMIANNIHKLKKPYLKKDEKISHQLLSSKDNLSEGSK